MRSLALFLTLLGLLLAPTTRAAEPAPLLLETKIPLGAVVGRIDHFAIDRTRQRLFVAELGNNSVGVVDLTAQKLIRTLAGLREPQGVAYIAATDTLAVANAGDGSVRFYQGADLVPSGRLALGEDADNIRVDTRRNRVLIGYGSGAIAIIDAASQRKIAEIPLKAHPESFRFDETGDKLFVNVPDARQIAVIDIATGRQTATLSPTEARANFALAYDDTQHRLLSVFRSPPTLIAFDGHDGKKLASLPTCGDADDLFVDAKRQRVYVSCGDGVIDVLAQRDAGYERVARIPTAAGARTSLFVPELDRLYVAVRVAGDEPAAIWVFRAGA